MPTLTDDPVQPQSANKWYHASVICEYVSKYHMHTKAVKSKPVNVLTTCKHVTPRTW